MKPLRHILCAVLLITGVSQAATPVARPRITNQPFSFAAIGDTPYSEREAMLTGEVLQQIAQDDAAFIVHTGDIKGGAEPCSDELFGARKALLEQARQPLILIPGDNEWTDCQRASAGRYDPVERLQRLRELFFNDEFSLGQEKLRLTRQSEMSKFRSYSENVRWEYNSILFAGLNIPGSNNNYQTAGGRNGEFEDRLIANRVWLNRAFAHARQKHLPGIVIVIQANPDFEHLRFKGRRDGYREFRQQLAALTAGYPGQVLLIHGDSHRHQINQPLKHQGKTLSNFTRLEVFGSPIVSHWVKIKVQPGSRTLFKIETRSGPGQ